MSKPLATKVNTPISENVQTGHSYVFSLPSGMALVLKVSSVNGDELCLSVFAQSYRRRLHNNNGLQKKNLQNIVFIFLLDIAQTVMNKTYIFTTTHSLYDLWARSTFCQIKNAASEFIQ